MSLSQDFEFVIQWHLTERCNLRCSHCYQDGSPPGRELATDEIHAVLDEIGELFTTWSGSYNMQLSPSFNITGGEPLLRRDLYDVIRDVASHGWDVFLLTNGTLIDAREARRIADAGVRGVQVSMEGPEAIHDTLRGEGSFRASIAGISALLQAGAVVTVNTTLSEINAEEFFALAELVAGLGVQRLGFSRLVPSGRGGSLGGRMLSPDAVRRLYERIFALSLGGMTLVTGDPVATQLRAREDAPGDRGDIPAGGCSAGVSGITLLADGTIVPCRRLPIPLGNVRTDALREVWASSSVLEALRTRSGYDGPCGSCARWAGCRGCRAIAYAASQREGAASLLARDPQCPLGRGEQRREPLHIPVR
jgi:MoaA/NifB/PqqE/SkfB family radical SAM enzyme